MPWIVFNNGDHEGARSTLLGCEIRDQALVTVVLTPSILKADDSFGSSRNIIFMGLPSPA